MTQGIYERTDWHRQKMKWSDERKQKASKYWSGRPKPLIRGVPRPPMVRKSIGDTQRGKKHNFERRLANSLAQTGKDGSDCNFRKDGLYENIYGIGFTDFFKYTIRNEFDNLCVLCLGDGNGHVVEVHHIGERKDHSIDNLITFCKKCHISIHADEEFWNGTLYLNKRGVVSNGSHGK